MAKNATTAIFIDKYHPQKDGTCAVSIRITFDRKKRYYPTKYNLTPEDFEKVKSAERPRDEIKQIRLKLQALEKRANDIIDDMPFFDWVRFESKFEEHKGNRHRLEDAFNAYIEQLKKEERLGSASTYQCALNSLRNFKSDSVFTDVTPSFLTRYERWMLANDNSVTTIGIYLRSLRTLFNQAIEGGIVAKDLYPFGKRKYEIPYSNNVKKALSLADIGSIYNYFPKEGSSEERMRDYWLFMYLCNGLNVKDMCLLRYKNIQGKMLVFERAKTARTKRKVEPIRVSLLPEAKAIIEKWGNKQENVDTFIFPVLSEKQTPERQRQLIQQLTHLINDNMRKVAAALRIETPITTYAARHSFATVLKRKGVSAEFISEALGHSSLATTQRYLASFEDEYIHEQIKVLTVFE